MGTDDLLSFRIFPGHGRHRGHAWLCLVLLASGIWLMAASATPGQTVDGSGDSLTATPDSPSSEPTASPGPGEGDTEPTRTLLDTLLDGGIVGLLIGILSIISVGFIVEHFLSIRKSALMPADIADELEELIHQGHLDRAVQVCQETQHQSLISDVVLAGLNRFASSEFGFAEYKAAVEEAGEDHTGRLYRKTEVLGVIGSVAPMLGLTGTVLGMIEAFNKIASTGGAARPDELAGGIGKALVTTLLGLIVAIPTMIAFSFFRNKIDSIVAEAGKRVEQIMMPLGRRRPT